MSRGRIAAFFDLDGTLLLANSGELWMRREREHGRIGRWQMLQALYYLTAYRFGVIDMESVMNEALKTVKGVPSETVREWTEEWFFQKVTPFVAPGALDALDAHRARGHMLVLLTSSSPYESKAAGAYFALDAWIHTRYEVDGSGRLTGRVVPPVCFGAGKVALAERFAAERGVDLDASYFYSDSITDREMLERAGRPRVVHPDPRLRRLARKRGWPVLDWRSSFVRGPLFAD
ncbi:MAG: HAD-IB family hydrolase [Deltaproteobacteria bacterium]|nr:HAD-IB family hydrolase [Deltaproteobacteria bacterium]